MMTRLRVLVAVFLLLAVVGTMNFVPFGSSPVAAATAKAKHAASALVFGNDVTLQTYGKDKYGRTLAARL